jgi:4-hydroxybenzoate polyprenyltransferase
MMIKKLRLALAMIKFSHTIFALPFALGAGLLAARRTGGLAEHGAHWLLYILLAMIGARSAAMTFNRIADLRYDRQNPRTQGWPLVSGALGLGFAWGFFLATCALFVFAAWRLNPLAFRLSPAALAVICFYSLTKRFTSFTHFFLGLSLGIAPIGAWVAVTGRIEWPALALGLAVLLWVAGFDLIYHCQDIAIDTRLGLHSLPVKLGIKSSLILSALLHLMMMGTLVATGMALGLGPAFFIGLGLLGLILAWEHTLVTPTDLSRVNAAFFTLNGWVAMLFLAAVAADFLLH